MSDTTPILGLPEILSNQAQKHLTHNEALVILDALVQGNVASKTTSAPPGSPTEGDRYIIGPSPTGAWATHADKLAVWDGSAWNLYTPTEGWRFSVRDEAQPNLALYDGSAWVDALAGATSSSFVAAESANGAQMQFRVLEEELTGLSGADVDSTINIPNGAIVFNVSMLVTTTITGATSFSVGVSGNTGQFGSGLSLPAASNNLGVIGPTAFYSDTPIKLTSAGGNFTAGAVRIAIHYYMPRGPQT